MVHYKKDLANALEAIDDWRRVIESREAYIARDAKAERERVLDLYGSFDAYYNALEIKELKEYDEDFERYYKVFSEMFGSGNPLDARGIARRVERSDNPALLEKYGPMRGRFIAAFDPISKELVAAAMYFAVPFDAAQRARFGFDAGVYVGTTFARPVSRMPRIMEFIVEVLKKKISATLIDLMPDMPPPRFDHCVVLTNFYFPLDMTVRRFLHDWYASGINGFDRVMWFMGLGFRVLDVYYFRKSARPDMPDLPGMYYAVMMPPDHDSIDAELLMFMHERHCACFYDVFDPATDGPFNRLGRDSRALGRVPLKDAYGMDFYRLRRQAEAWLNRHAHENVPSIDHGVKGFDLTLRYVIEWRQ